MIPVSLTIEGVYSYQKKQTIDFTELTGAGIFGIFGQVGSGKSAILEAITFALYGETDRLNKSGDDRNYNMMNLKSDTLNIEFIFRTGCSDTQYLVTVKGKRNGKQFEVVKALERNAYKMVDGWWEPIDIQSLESIIGLSYENFKRTIIIPQGRFQEFLQLGNADRTRMMKDLFGLNRFELYYQVVSAETKNNERMQNVEGQMSQVGEVSEDRIAITAGLLETLKKEIIEKSSELAAVKSAEAEMSRLKDLFSKAAQLREKIGLLKSEEESIGLLEKKTKEYEQCRIDFQSLLDARGSSQIKINSFEELINKESTLRSAISSKLQQAEKDFEAVKSAYDMRQALKEKADELEKFEKIISLKIIASALIKRIADGEKEIEKTVAEAGKFKNEFDVQELLVKKIREKAPDMKLLSEANAWHTAKKSHDARQRDLINETAALLNNIEEIENSAAALWNDECFEGMPVTKDLVAASAFLEDKKAVLKTEIEELAKESEHLNFEKRLGEFAGAIKEGKPCPLCGATEHPDVLNTRDVSGTLTKILGKKREHERLISSIEKKLKILSVLFSDLKYRKERLETLSLSRENLDKMIAVHANTFRFSEYSDEESVARAFKVAEEINTELTLSEEKCESLKLLHEKAFKNREIFEKAIEGIKHNLTSNQAETSTLAGQIKILKIEDFENPKSEDLIREKNECLRRYSEAEKKYKTGSDLITSLKQELNIISGQINANTKTLAIEKNGLKDTDEKLNKRIESSDWKTVEEVESILAQSIDTEKCRKEIAEFRQNLDFSMRSLYDVEKETGDRLYDGKLHTEMTVKIIDFENYLDIKKQDQGRLESERKNLERDIKIFNKLKKEISELQVRAEDLKTLKGLFKASGFVNYISTVYLQELCYAANERFYKLTRQRLSLEVTPDNNFQVRDFMNGGKTRNVKTLSGGQTFQAALSLALALADNIQKITESNQNFFFLDEGFGSLDKESLDVVFDTLKALRKENRIVGVISHVEDMQQEIDTHLRVINDPEKGSVITPGWN